MSEPSLVENLGNKEPPRHKHVNPEDPESIGKRHDSMKTRLERTATSRQHWQCGMDEHGGRGFSSLSFIRRPIKREREHTFGV